MLSRLSILLLFLFLVVLASGQNITRHESDSLLQLLNKGKPDTARINLLLQLAKFQIFKPGEYKQDLDSASVYIEKAKVINATLKSGKSFELITLTEAFLIKERGQTELSKKMVEQMIGIISKEKDKTNLADAYFELSDYYDYANPEQLVKKINLVELAVPLYEQMGNKRSQALGLKVLADLYDQQDDYAKALQKINLSLDIYKSINYNQLQAVYTLYGTIYYQLANYDKALYYELQALENSEKTGDTSTNLCQINYSIGVILITLDEKKRAINYFKAALQIAEKYNDNRNVLLVLMSVTDCLVKLNLPGEALDIMNNVPRKFLAPKINEAHFELPIIYIKIYSALENYKMAQIYANQLIDVIKDYKDGGTNLHTMYNVLISYYINSGQLMKAGIYLKKSDLVSRKIGDPNRINRNTFLKFQLDTAQGNFRSAVLNLLTYNKVNDSLFNEKKSKQIKQLEVEYETAKKEDSIKIRDKSIIVLNQDYQLQQSNLRQARLVKNFTLTGIVVLIIIMALLYRQYRNKQLTNQTITHKNELLEHLVKEKEWLLKEVHHRVKNNLHTVICLLESQAEYLKDDALKAIENSQHRIYAMSLIHQELYQLEDVKTIDMSVYLPEFTRYLGDSFGTNGQIRFQLNVEPLKLDVSQAIPIALIINEAVTNSIKYAFPHKRAGIIDITMHRNADDITLIIADNGIGIDLYIAKAPLDSLGLKLIKGLSEDINGDISFENDEGTKIKIVFSVDPLHDDNKSLIIGKKEEEEVYV